jgi:GNAT superfamily N-acetyltransferase
LVYQVEEQGDELLAVARDGTVLGRANAAKELHGQPLAPRRLFVQVAVEEAHRGRGVGAALYRALLGLTGQASALDCAVAAGEEAALGFATRRGFRFDYQILDASLDLARFDPAPFAGIVAAVEARGIRFTTLAESPGLMPALYDLDRTASEDVPEWSGYMPPYDKYGATLAENGLEGVHIALEEGRPVGFITTDATGYTHFLCVAPSHRGRNIALALKLLTIEWASRIGLTQLTTNTNAASRAITLLNQRLGYVTSPGTIYLTKP